MPRQAVTMSVSFPPELYEELEESRKRACMTRSQFIRVLIAEGLKSDQAQRLMNNPWSAYNG